MARKKSLGCGTVIIGLIALAMAATYWYVLVAIGFVALAIWGIVKLIRSWSKPGTPDKTLELQGTVSTAVAGTPAKQSARTKCAFCYTTGLHSILRVTEKTIDCHCIACGKNFFVFKSDGNLVVTDTPAHILISAPETNTLINHHIPQNDAELLEKTLDRNNANSKADQVNAVIEKDLAKEKATAEVAMKIINRLESALVDTEIQRILDSKKTALQERVAQVNAEIEQILANEKAAASALIAAEKAAAAEVTVKESASEEEITNRLGAALVDAEIERILEAEKAASQERVALVDSEIGRDLSTENVTTTPTEIHKIDKPIEKRIGHFIDNGDGTVTDSRNGLTWMRCAMGQMWADHSCQGVTDTYTWKNAKALSHIFAGHDDWRLPTCDELKSIIEPSQKYPTINAEAFPETVSLDFWSSSRSVNDSSFAWINNFKDGNTYVRNKNLHLPVRLVRGGNVGRLDHELIAPLVTSTKTEAVSFDKPYTPFETKAATDLTEINKKASLHERVAQVYAEIESILATEKAAAIAASAENVAAEQKNEHKTRIEEEQTDNQVEEICVPSVESQWILDSENIGVSERVAQVNDEIKRILDAEKAVVVEQKTIEKRSSGHFIDNGDGTVTDTNSGLTWMRCAIGQTWDGTSCMGTAKFCDWDRANVLSLSFAGRDDWRLPTIDELKTIIDPTQINSEIFFQTANSWFWSSTPFDDHSDYAWAINSRTGRTITLKKSKYRSIRLVLRGCVKALDSESTESNDGTLVITGKNSEQKYFTDTSTLSAKYAKPKDCAIPSPPSKPIEGFSLDMSSIEAKLAETAAVSAILKDIFTEDAPLPPQTAVKESAAKEISIAGLDAESFSFMQALATQHIWTRDELEKLAADHSLMLDGALDSINDASFDHFGGPFFEGEDPIEIDPEIVSRLETK